MTRALLATIVLTLATVLATVPATAVAVAAPAGDDFAQGWAPRHPGWLDPAPRGRTVASGDGLRALPPRALTRLPRRPARRTSARLLRGPALAKASLSRLGRRQTDGG
jgi:hypothetical protein